MSYEVIARKWRPQQFADVVGQDHVVRTLRNALESDRLAHAYLFVGPRGIGKTSIARIFAKAINCEKGLSAMPCDGCDSCREIMAGNNLDVREIDGASNNKVDEVRELRETIRYSPARGRFKLIIIDEVHMLSVAAFNALLKTLEEPPPHVKFMFATTEPQKIPATIISRCQRFDLRRIGLDAIIERLRLIAADEEVTVDEAALLAIARGSEGGLRDAESALDQLIAFRGKSIAEDDVLNVFGLVSQATLRTLTDQVLRGDLAGVIATVDRLEQGGKDLQRLVLELMERFRNLLVCLHLPPEAPIIGLTEAQAVELRAQAGGADSARLLRIGDILAEAETRMRLSLSKRILIETALVRCARAATVATIEDLLAAVEALRPGAAASGLAPESRDMPAGKTPRTQDESRVVAPVAPVPRDAPVAVPPPRSAPDTAAELERLRQQWPEVIERAGRVAMPVQAPLKDAAPVAVSDDAVHILVDPEFGSAMALFEENRNHKAVEQALKHILGRPVRATFAIGLASTLPRPEATPQPEDGAEGESADAGGGGGIQNWSRRPEVRKVMDMFNGTVLDVRE